MALSSSATMVAVVVMAPDTMWAHIIRALQLSRNLRLHQTITIVISSTAIDMMEEAAVRSRVVATSLRWLSPQTISTIKESLSAVLNKPIQLSTSSPNNSPSSSSRDSIQIDVSTNSSSSNSSKLLINFKSINSNSITKTLVRFPRPLMLRASLQQAERPSTSATIRRLSSKENGSILTSSSKI